MDEEKVNQVKNLIMQTRNLIMRDITEMTQADPNHQRAVCVDYDYLYEVITDRLVEMQDESNISGILEATNTG